MSDKSLKQSNLRQQGREENILLMTLPFWSPLIPAQGIAVLKGFLQHYGYRVRTVDGTSESMFTEMYNLYFDILKEAVPAERRGNFLNLGHDVLRDHMMAHAYHTCKDRYYELVKRVIAQTYFTGVDDALLDRLEDVLARLFERLKDFVLDWLEREKPSVLGLSATSDNLAPTRYIFQLAREHYPHIKTVMGGCVFFNHLADGNPDLDYFLEQTRDYIDKIIVGKGEVLLLKYLRGELPGSQRLLYHAHLEEEEVAKYEFQLPDLSDYDLQKYLYLAGTGSTSCPYDCSFCNSRAFFGKFKKKNPVQTVSEIVKLQQRYGHKLFFMTDALLNPVISDMSEEIIKQGTVVYLDGYFTVDRQSENIDNTLLWRRGGFYRARLGCESGSQKVLDLIGKKITPNHTRKVLAALAHAGIKTTTYWVIGHPGETEEDFQQTLDLLEEMKNDIWQAECNPFRYYYVGQAQSNEWAGRRRLLHPENARDMLTLQTWTVDGHPTREQIYDRVFRFAQHCEKLGIPNPYSFDEIYRADERWKKLHKNAVPPIMELMDNDGPAFDERQSVEHYAAAETDVDEDGDFCF